MTDPVTHPWDDPNLKTLYHVQLETADLLVSYEIATADFDAVDIAKADLAPRLREGTPLWCGGTSSIGYVAADVPPIVEMRVIAGTLPPVGFDGKPVNVVVTSGPDGQVHIGTDQVVVSKFREDQMFGHRCNGDGAKEGDLAWCSSCGRTVEQDAKGSWTPSEIQLPPPGPAWEKSPKMDYTGMSFMHASSVAPEPKMTRLHQAFWNNTAGKPESAEAQHLKIKELEAIWSENE